MPGPRELVLEIAARCRADISGTDIRPRTAFVLRLARRLAWRAGRIRCNVQISVIAAEAIDRKFNRSLSRLDDSGAADTRHAAIVLNRRRNAIFQPAYGDRIVGARKSETPGVASSVTLTTRGAIRGIAAANFELEIVTASTIEPRLGLRDASRRQQDPCEHGPQQDWKSHARAARNSRVGKASPANILAHPQIIVQVRIITERLREFVLPNYSARRRGRRALDPAARGDDRGCRIRRPIERESAVWLFITKSGAGTDSRTADGCRCRTRRASPRGSGGVQARVRAGALSGRPKRARKRRREHRSG